MDDLVKWFGEQLDEDERIVRAATPGPWERTPERPGTLASAEYWHVVDCSETPAAGANIEHIAAWEPARVLREIDAKRQLVKLHGRATLHAAGGGAQYFDTMVVCRSCEPNRQWPELSWPCTTLRLLALPYADRPGYREDWRP